MVVTFILQMSKSTGNFLTLREAIEKFSADGTFVTQTTGYATILIETLIIILLHTAIFYPYKQILNKQMLEQLSYNYDNNFLYILLFQA